MFLKCMKAAMANSQFSGEVAYQEIPVDMLFAKFVVFIHDVMKCNMFSKRIESWFNDNTGDVTRDFGFRFRGQESWGFLTHFPAMIILLLRHAPSSWHKILLRLHFQCILLRQIVSLCARITRITRRDLNHLKKISRQHHPSCCLFDPSYSPTM